MEPIIPIFKRWNPELEQWQWGLSRDDFMRVQSGMGCGRCLEPFVTWLPVCPVCGNEIEDVVEAPSEWRGRRE